MKRFSNRTLGIDQGSVMLFSSFKDGGAMWTGHGPREERRRVEFSEPFRTPPIVQVALSLWDMDQQTNQRADLATENITEAGFDIVFRTWGDTRVARVRVDWTAMGELSDEDDWELY